MSSGSESIKQECACNEPLPYYLPTEVALHNRFDDCWVSYLGDVYDLTALCSAWKSTKELKPIIAHAGKDISHWFDHRRCDLRKHVHPVTGALVPYCPHGPIPDVGPDGISAINWRQTNRCPWWLDDKHRKGHLSKNARPCRILNVFAGTKVVISVCEEDTVSRIQERFLVFNAHGASYEWKFESTELNMNKTLTQNGIPDERERYVACGLPENIYIPTLLCYFRDDLTEA